MGSDDELMYDGTRIEELCLNYVLPGYDDIDLCKGGRDKTVTLDNLEHYTNVSNAVESSSYQQGDILRL